MRRLRDLINEKKLEKLGQKVYREVKSRNLIDCVDDGLQSAMTYIYIGSMT
jgi:hypothetical protein